MTPFRELMSFDEPNVDIKSDYDFTKNRSQYYSVEDIKIIGLSAKTVTSIQSFKSLQVEIKRLQNKVNVLQDEKSVLVKWINFLY